jgi:hypothetical protein
LLAIIFLLILDFSLRLGTFRLPLELLAAVFRNVEVLVELDLLMLVGHRRNLVLGLHRRARGHTVARGVERHRVRDGRCAPALVFREAGHVVREQGAGGGHARV